MGNLNPPPSFASLINILVSAPAGSESRHILE